MIIKCPECEKDVSDKAKACQYCGFPIESFIKKAKYDAKASELKTRLKEKAPDFGRRLLKNIGKLALLAAVLFGIGALIVALGPVPRYSKDEYMVYVFLSNILSNAIWLTLLGGTKLLWKGWPKRWLWLFFMCLSSITVVMNTFLFLGSGDVFFFLYTIFVLVPWIIIARAFYVPSKNKKIHSPN